MPVRGLTILVATADPVRLRSALTLAVAQAALGGTARLFADAGAVSLLSRPADAEDARHVAGGYPALAALLDEALGAGVSVTACQTGLALAGLTPASFDPRIDFAGVTGLLSTLGDDRLLAL